MRARLLSYVEKRASSEERPHAVIIHGNPRWAQLPGKAKIAADAFTRHVLRKATR